MSLLDVPVGPFRLNRLIGVGGAGEVWQGLHVSQAVPVAVKVITAARARDPKYHEAFQNEVRAVAGLDHPGVVVVFDAGIVGEEAERASLGRMVAGSPYLAMELASKGSLRTHPTPVRWSELRAQLLWLLDILAHAHAHGVIHRDLKPGNVLVFDEPAPGDETGASVLRLTDFGLAHATDRAERAIKGTSGTPVFMAPEQFRGQWRDFGPWTDLYALGCMAYSLAAGVPPFRGRGVSQLMQSHLSSPPPPLEPRFPVPEGFVAWIHRLMHKDPEQRFQRASDAVWALIRLGEPVELQYKTGTPMMAPMRGHQPTMAMHTLTRSWPDWEKAMEADQDRRGLVSLPPTRLGAPGTELCERRVPPLPRTWRIPHQGSPSMRLVGAGLGLYGMREIPLVGREAEQDQIWDALRQARTQGEVRCCVLRGSAGAGKSRLAERISQRADEVGNAVVVRATHSPGGGPADGLSRMVSAALGCVGMTRVDLQKRVERFLRLRGVDDEYEWRALVELIWPLPDEDERRAGQKTIRFGSANERYALIHRLLGYVAGHQDEGGVYRPVVLWLDDAQWGSDALGLATYLLSRVEGNRPILVLMTVQDEALEYRAVERGALERVLSQPGVAQLELGPLDVEQRRELVQKLLFLEGDLAAQVEARTGGNPLFAVQLVGDWVQRGVLEVGATGFVLKRGELAAIPDDIHVLWEGRIGRVLEGHPASARSGLELAALMGADVDDAEWRGACTVARLDVPTELVSQLLARRLARQRPGGWSFAHGMMRESLERSAVERGVAPELHRAAATTLQIRYDVQRQPGIAERLGRHLFHAGQAEEALEPLGTGARERRAMSDYAGAMQLLDLRDVVLQQLGVPEDDPVWGEGWVQRAEILIGQGQLEEAAGFGLKAVEQGRLHGWDHLIAPAYRTAAMAVVKQGKTKSAEEWLVRGEEAARAWSDELETARCLLALGDAMRLQGRHEEAMHNCRRALARFAALEDVRGQADALAAIAGVCRVMGDLEKTEAYAREAIPFYEAVGGRFGVGNTRNTLGDVLRARGDLQGAEQTYREAESILRSLGSPEHYIPMLNLGLLLVEQARYGEAKKKLTLVLAAMKRSRRRGLEGAVHVLLLPCVAHAREWPAFDEHLVQGRELLMQTGFVDGDIAETAEMGARLAHRLGESARGVEAWRLAHHQWSALGNVDRASAIEGLPAVVAHPDAWARAAR